VTRPASVRPPEPCAGTEDEAIAFARHLARVFGAVARFHVCRTSPPAIVGSSAATRQQGDAADVLNAVREFAAGSRLASRPVGRGVQLSVLSLPGPDTDGLALVVEVDSGPVARAARVLAALADPEGTGDDAATEHLGNTVSRLLDLAESECGVRAPEMSRTQKQHIVKELDERGAFLIKKSVEQVAERLGVSRFTIYNYLDQANRDGASGPAERDG
jgi:DNA-binding CsgD family transcriptional regulator